MSYKCVIDRSKTILTESEQWFEANGVSFMGSDPVARGQATKGSSYILIRVCKRQCPKHGSNSMGRPPEKLTRF